MSGLLFAPGLGRATTCQVSRFHRPVPMRFVWHHILPQACGGRTVPENLANLCDSCHYAVHVLLRELRDTDTIRPDRRNNRKREQLALQGYRAAVAAKTVAQIPNEGSSVL